MDRPVASDLPPPAPAPVVDDDSASIPWHYIDASGETRGPVSFRVIRAQLRCAMLPPDAMVWREGLDEWCEARVFPAFASCVEDDAGSGRLDATSRPATAGPAPRIPPRATMPNAPATATPALGGSRSPARTLAPAALFADAPPPPPPTTTTTSDDASSDDAPAWFAVDAAGTQVGPVDTAAMLRLVWRDGSGVLTRSERAQPDWIPARDAPALREAIRTMESARAESVKRTGGVGQTHGDGDWDGGAKMNLSAESLRVEAASLRAALETTRAKLLAKEAEAASLRETVRHLRVRIATGGRLTVAGDAGGSTDGSNGLGVNELDRAELEAAELARARRELEDRTAELVRLKGVLRGELLRRVLEDAETTRTSLGRLDVATD